MTIPFLEVAHLASSSSFYSAILQALDLRYIAHSESSPSKSPSAGPCITYGTSLPPTPIFQLRQVRDPKPSRIVLTAPSPAAVTDFRRFALRANPDLVPSAGFGGHTATADTEESRARIIDYDGNTMEVVYRPPYQSRHPGPSVRHTQSTTDEAARILKWNYGTVSSNAPTVIGRRTETSYFGGDDAPMKGLRRAMTSTSLYETAPQREATGGFNPSTVMGTLLGVAAGAAAGAAITYSMVKNESSRAANDYEAPAFVRRSTFPAAYFSSGDHSVPRYVEVERTVEKVRYPHDYPPVDTRRPPPEYIARYSQVGGSQRPSSRVAEDVIYDDTRSRHSSRHSSSSRTRSANPEKRRPPLMITETEHRSVASSSRHGSTPPVTRGSIHRSHTFDVSDRESYVSARSERSQSTIRPPPASSSQYGAAKSRVSRVTTTTVRTPVPTPRAPLSRSGSYMSARNVPLPPSVVTGYRNEPWNVPLPPSHVESSWDDDDAGSVAPSDSISCVGSRRSGRSYHV